MAGAPTPALLTAAQRAARGDVLATTLHDAALLGAMACIHGDVCDDHALDAAQSRADAFLAEPAGPAAAAQAKEAHALARRARNEAVAHLCTQIDTRGPGEPVVVFNTLSWLRTGVVRVAAPPLLRPCRVLDRHGQHVPAQFLGEDTLVFLAADIPAQGYAVFHLEPGEAPESAGPEVDGRTLANELLRLTLDDAGRWTALEQRDTGARLLTESPLAPLVGPDGEACPAAAVTPGAGGPVCATLRLRFDTPDGQLTQELLLVRGEAQVRVHTHAIDRVAPHLGWRWPAGGTAQTGTALGLHAQPAGTADAGAWAAAGGVALLGSGWACTADADGLHAWWTPWPDGHAQHAISCGAGPVVRAALDFRHPLLPFLDSNVQGPMPNAHSFATAAPDSVVIADTRKVPDTQTVRLTLCETAGAAAEATLRFGHAPQRLTADAGTCAVADKTAKLALEPQQTRTLDVSF